MKPVRYSGRFKKDFRRIEKRGYDLPKLAVVIEALRLDRPLPAATRPHPLKGEWSGYHECHVGGDWLLIYQDRPTELFLTATGTHSDLFDE